VEKPVRVIVVGTHADKIESEACQSMDMLFRTVSSRFGSLVSAHLMISMKNRTDVDELRRLVRALKENDF
jgi:GTP-binding protein EngB required for normal cell division